MASAVRLPTDPTGACVTGSVCFPDEGGELSNDPKADSLVETNRTSVRARDGEADGFAAVPAERFNRAAQQLIADAASAHMRRDAQLGDMGDAQ